MNKKDLKKLALLGLTSGVMLGTGGVQAANTQANTVSGSLLAHACGGGCGGKKANRSGCSSSYSSCGSQSNQPKSGCSSYSSCGGANKSDRGFVAGGCGAGSCSNHNSSKGGTRNYIAEVNETLSTSSGQLMTEDQLKSQLNDQGKQTYNSLTPEGKAMAVKLASRSCKGTNDCKGQNACKADDHSCAGKGSCAGSSICSFKDKNMAVKIAAQKQAEKRTNANSGS